MRTYGSVGAPAEQSAGATQTRFVFRQVMEFLAACRPSTSVSAGGSEPTPYADTVKTMMETYQKHGLIPLADAALERAAKDAMAAKAREAANAGDAGNAPAPR